MVGNNGGCVAGHGSFIGKWWYFWDTCDTRVAAAAYLAAVGPTDPGSPVQAGHTALVRTEALPAAETL